MVSFSPTAVTLTMSLLVYASHRFDWIFRQTLRSMSRQQECQRRERSRSSVSEAWISMRFLICPPMNSSSFSVLALAEGSREAWPESPWPWSRSSAKRYCILLFLSSFLICLLCFQVWFPRRQFVVYAGYVLHLLVIMNEFIFALHKSCRC